MMEPRIQYAKTSDGVSIAFWTLGEGPPFVEMPSVPWSHVQMELQIPLWRAWDERLAEKRLHVRYDHRGTGMSQRSVTEVSLDALMLDLEAVVDHLGLERFALFGHHLTGAVAIAYAARNPQRVSRLVLWCAYARGIDFNSVPQVRAIQALMGQDWETLTETIAHVGYGWTQGEEARRSAALLRECSSWEVWKALTEVVEDLDVTHLLPRVEAPTLVIQRRGYPLVNVEVAQELASKIPHAELALLEGTSGVIYLENMEALATAIDAFLAEGEEATPTAQAPPGSGAFRTVLFTDLVGHTEMMSRLGDDRGRAVLREHERITREVLKAHGGTEVKTMGDGFMASFGSVTKAVECAMALQRAVEERSKEQVASGKGTEPLSVRVGLNAGEPIEEEGDLFGATVILAARIAAKADGGEILVANAVRELCAGKGFLFADRGEFVAKGFEEPVRLYEVRWRD